jgi:Glycosyl hydrolases family 38 N-terminal domain
MFGLSSTNARLYADMGLKAIFMNRVDVHEREVRRERKELEFIWRPYWQYSGIDT